MDKATKWSGKLLDAAGRVGKIDMEVGAEGGRGTFRLELQERDGRPVSLKGEVSLTAEGDGYRMRSSAESEQQGGKAEWQATLTRADAGRYAKSAMLGTFGVTGAAPGVPLTHGVVILWQFS